MWQIFKKKQPEPFLTRRNTPPKKVKPVEQDVDASLSQPSAVAEPSADMIKKVVVGTVLVSVVIGGLTVLYTNLEPTPTPVAVRKSKVKSSEDILTTAPVVTQPVSGVTAGTDRTDESEENVQIIPLDLSAAEAALPDAPVEKASTQAPNAQTSKPKLDLVDVPAKKVVSPEQSKSRTAEPKLVQKPEKVVPVPTGPKLMPKPVTPVPVVVEVKPSKAPGVATPPPVSTQTPAKNSVSLARTEGTSIPLSGESSQYFLLEKSGSSSEPILLIKKQSAIGTQYSKRVFNCVNKTSAYLGVGETMADMAASKADTGMTEIKPGSATWLLMKYACRG